MSVLIPQVALARPTAALSALPQAPDSGMVDKVQSVPVDAGLAEVWR